MDAGMSVPTIADFNLPAENVDEFRIRTRDVAGAHYYLDDIRLVSGNGGKVFRLAAVGIGEWLVGSITLVLVAADTGWDSDAQKLDNFTDVRELQRMLKTQGGEVMSEADESTTGPASLMLLDPDGNPILMDQHV